MSIFSDKIIQRGRGGILRGDPILGRGGAPAQKPIIVYAVHSGTGEVRWFDEFGDNFRTADIGSFGLTAVTVDKISGDIYACGTDERKAVKLDNTGSTLWTSPDPGGTITSVVVDDSGFVYLGHSGTDGEPRLRKLDPATGNVIWGMTPDGSGLTSQGQPGRVYGLSFHDGEIIVGGVNTVYRIDTDGNQTFGGGWGAGVDNRFFEQVVVGPEGHIYAASGSGLYKINVDGDGFAWNFLDGSFRGVYVDSDDFSYVSDSSNDRLIRFTPNGVIDNISATDSPRRIHHRNGRIYVSGRDLSIYDVGADLNLVNRFEDSNFYVDVDVHRNEIG